jgi:carboxypeptidase C (cathepsin A)
MNPSVLVPLLLTSLMWQRPGGAPQAQAPKPEAAASAATPATMAELMREKPPVVSSHQIQVNGKTLSYKVTTGYMPMKSAEGEVEAQIFYMAYTLDGVADPTKRPLMFSFNGGPGSSSVWLHMGALGPRRVKMNDDGSMPAPPFQLVDNAYTWLDETDLVFIDPVGTGYSRAARQEVLRRTSSLQGDLASVGEFIRMYLTRESRWMSPLFLVGESYGTFRAAGLAGYLIDRGVAFNGIILVSTILNYQTVSFAQGNDISYALHLPSYTATAWYHKKLPPDLQKQDLKTVLKESETWSLGGYQEALAKGDRLTDAERKAAIAKTARLTGLSERYVEESDLRIPLARFLRELLRDKKLMAGRLDSRLTGPAPLNAGDSFEFDPSNSAIRPPYTAAFADYVRRELKFESDLQYHILGGGILRWDFSSDNGYAETTDLLRRAFAQNPTMKVLQLSGYYDMATPYFAMEYTLSHSGFHPTVRGNISKKFYEAGHMMYIHLDSLKKMKQDAADFVRANSRVTAAASGGAQ